MRRIQEIEHANSCLNRADDHEPIFILRANDPLAANIIRSWAFKYWADKADPNASESHTTAQVVKYREALALADEMEEWRLERGLPIQS